MTKMTSLRNRRRAAVTVALTTAMATTIMSATAFMTADTAPSLSSIATRPRAPTAIFARDVSSSSQGEKKPSIETITDANRHLLLRPPSSPSRPVLVDAMAPWCGPCKILDKVLRKAQPRYAGRVDFCRWNVNDAENTAGLKDLLLGSGFALAKLPSLLVFKDGAPIAVRAGMANEFQLDAFLEQSLPELERTFDEDGLKMVPLPRPEGAMAADEGAGKPAGVGVAPRARDAEGEILRQMSSLAFQVEAAQQDVERAIQDEVAQEADEGDCTEPVECWERVDQTVWQNRTVVSAMAGVLLPARNHGLRT